ncbi:hypothetical protein FJW07_25975 [Mesorhizobium sp. B3-1-9]|uniref:hypothetical protein n=1 Tax=Mesorhizobium sp. B3-1-9 TaxID=2589892 RepID=UPI00112B2C18|nr:hypothetical protein [Mesorhizobium sp. B3-1-9]TPI33269.1 hypothetical protein FJW07_25975 [Mesorhizobium sp. B3-1-9]
MIGGGRLCNRIETGAGRAGILNPRQPFDGHRSWSAQICACRAGPTVSSLTQQCLNRARRRRLPPARDPSKQAFSETGIRLLNCRSASSINTRIFRYFSGSGEARLAATEFPHFRKPLHFNEKYAYIE